MQNDERIPNLASKFKSDNIWPFLAKKGVKCYLIWILRLDSESSRHLEYLRPPFDIIFRLWFCDLPMHFQNFQIAPPHGFRKLRIFFHIFGIRVVLCKGIPLSKLVLLLTTHPITHPEAERSMQQQHPQQQLQFSTEWHAAVRMTRRHLAWVQ